MENASQFDTKERGRNPQNAESVRNEINRIIKSMNKAWLAGDFSRFRDFLHENIVIVMPDMKRIGIGIKPCIKSYKEFVTRSHIFSFKEKSINVDAFDKTAVATFEYTIDYEVDKRRNQEHGKEILVFSKDPDKWQLIWRMIVAVSG